MDSNIYRFNKKYTKFAEYRRKLGTRKKLVRQLDGGGQTSSYASLSWPLGSVQIRSARSKVWFHARIQVVNH